jgi:hypothetical protein
MVTISNDDEELDNKIRKETRRDDRYPEKEIEADGFKRFNGLVIVPKKLEPDIIQTFEKGTLARPERLKRFKGITTSLVQ